MNRQGSILMYVLILILVTAFALVALLDLGANARNQQIRSENLKIADYAAEGAIQIFQNDVERNANSAGGTASYNISSRPVVVSSVADTANGRMTVTADVSISNKVYKVQRTVGIRRVPHRLDYAVFSAGDFSTSEDLVIGNSPKPAALGSNGNIVLTNSMKGGGDVEAAGTITGNGVGFTNLHPNMSALPLPNLVMPFGGIVLPVSSALSITVGPNGGGPYPYINQPGNFTLRGGTITGRFTMFVSGNLVITGDYVYGSAASRVVFVVGGNLDVKDKNVAIIGNFLVRGDAEFGLNVTLTRGSIAADSIDIINGELSVTFDDTFFQDRNELIRHRVNAF